MVMISTSFVCLSYQLLLDGCPVDQVRVQADCRFRDALAVEYAIHEIRVSVRHQLSLSSVIREGQLVQSCTDTESLALRTSDRSVTELAQLTDGKLDIETTCSADV